MNLKDLKADPNWLKFSIPIRKDRLRFTKRMPAPELRARLLSAMAAMNHAADVINQQGKKLTDTERRLSLETEHLRNARRDACDARRERDAARRELALIKQQVAAILAPPPEPPGAPRDNPWRVAKIYSSPAYALSSERAQKIQKP